MAEPSGLSAAIGAGDRSSAIRLVSSAIEEGTSPQAILDDMTQAMREVGERFSRNEIFVPEMLIAARAMKEAMAVLEPLLVDAGIQPEVTAVLGTVKGDLHDIGKNLVAMMWKGANFRVIDLGTNVEPEAFARAVVDHDARIVGASALLTTTMVGMSEVVAAVRATGRPGVAVIVGGAPVTEEFARSIGADAYAQDAATAVTVARTAMGITT
ncbi:MAG: cobalamin B12-binding domain-containing protein [Actinomycetota bacterium]